MKIVVIHGDDSASARARYVQIITGVKKKGWDIVPVEPTGTLAEQLVSTSLFTTNILYSIDGVKRLPVNEFGWLTKNADRYEGSLLIYTEGKFPATLRSFLPKSAKVETFDLPKIIWKFLDSFYPGNSKACLAFFEQLPESEAMELIIAMLARQLRDLYWAAEGGKGMNVAGWRMGRLKAQAAKFTKEELKDTINTLAEIDYKSKTSDFDAKLGIEMLILEKLS
jgi:hypothetical protein